MLVSHHRLTVQRARRDVHTHMHLANLYSKRKRILQAEQAALPKIYNKNHLELLVNEACAALLV